MLPGQGLKNVWLGVTVENQEMAEKRIPELIEQNGGCFKLFLSCDPLLGPIDLSPWIDDIDWVIVGAETGPNARSISDSWVQQISTCCMLNDIPYFFKSWGESPNMRFKKNIQDERREFPTGLN